MGVVVVLGSIVSLVLAIALCVKVLPEKYNGTFTKKPLQTLHDYFNFKKLYLETVLKFLFTLLSVACVVCGILIATLGNVFEVIDYIGFAVEYDYFRLGTIFEILFRNIFGGVGIAVLGPVALRLAYEAFLMFILLVKNVIDINKKLGKNSDKENG